MPEFFLLVDTVIFRKVEKNIISKKNFLFDPPTLNIICLAIFFFFLGSVCVFLRVTLLKVIVLFRFIGK